MSWQGQGWQSPGRCCLPEQMERHGGVMGDAGVSCSLPSPLPQTWETSPVWRDKLLILSFPLGAPLLPTTDVRGTAAPAAPRQPPPKIHPGALDDALSRLVPFGARQGRACPHGCVGSSVCPAAPVHRQGTLSRRPPRRKGSS